MTSSTSFQNFDGRHLVEYANLKFFSPQVRNLSYTLPDRLQVNKRNETFPGSEEFINEEKLGTAIWLDCI